MKVLFITSRSDHGGGPKHLVELLGALPDSIQAHVAAPLEGELAQELRDCSTHFFKLPHRRFAPIVALKLLLFCRDQSISLVHSHGRGAGSYSRFLALFGLSVIHTFHGANQPSRLKRLIEVPLKYLTQTFICVSESEKEVALSQHLALEQQIIVIPNGTKVFPYRERPLERPLMMGYLARFDLVKGHRELIAFLREMKTTSFTCLLGGSGEQVKEVERMVREYRMSDRVKFEGPIQNPSQFYERLNLAVSFSQTEGLPLTLIEAISHSLPVLVSDIPAHREVLNHREELLFRLDSPQEFIDKLESLFLLPRSYWEELHAEIVQKYDFKLQREKTFRLYYKPTF